MIRTLRKRKRNWFTNVLVRFPARLHNCGTRMATEAPVVPAMIRHTRMVTKSNSVKFLATRFDCTAILTLGSGLNIIKHGNPLNKR